MIVGGTEALIAKCVAKRAVEFSKGPVILIAHPGNNSLAASFEALACSDKRDLYDRIIVSKQEADDQT